LVSMVKTTRLFITPCSISSTKSKVIPTTA
jgi:hypothetical protein